jgi:hypothetical protein
LSKVKLAVVDEDGGDFLGQLGGNKIQRAAENFGQRSGFAVLKDSSAR